MLNLIRTFSREKYLKIIILSVIIISFLLLLYKNPFSERSLIPNLEPFPDTIHYLNPALNFIKGHSLLIEREGRTITPSVPFLYSAILIPGFLLISDVRFFYMTNVLLAFTSLFFFKKFLTKIILNNYVVLLILFLYVTNYFIYWFPNLPMAENLILPLFMVAIFLLVSKSSLKKAMLAALIAISFYATKYASLVLTLIFLGFYFIKIILEVYPSPKSLKLSTILEKKKLIYPAVFVISIAFSFLAFFLIEYLVKGNNILYQIYELIVPIFAKKQITVDAVPIPATSWFSLTYFSNNFPVYINAIMGNQMRFLWDFTPILPKYIAIPALIGIFAGILTRGYRFISLSLLFFILLPIIFISTFYSLDARYIYHTIPSLLAGFGIFLNLAYEALKRRKLLSIFYVILVIFFLFYSFSNFTRLKYQAVLNLKYAETPWYYVSVKTFNEYFLTTPETKKPQILITSLPPYYVDFFNTSGFKLLPLSTEQEFTKVKEIVWGNNDYSDFITLYKKYLNQGNDLFVTNAGLGNTGYLYRDYNLIKDNFTLTLVHKGCLDTCNIFKLNAKEQ